MMRSLWSGVAGLNTHQLEMDVIGNNISNVNTTAFKSSATGFQDVLYQTMKTGSAPGQNKGSTNISQVGLGSKVGSIFTNITKQGSAVTTYNPFDLMINGDSFFVVSQDAQAGTRSYTRDGAFTIDAQGNLVTQNDGYYVMGLMGNVDIPRQGNVVLQRLELINNRTKTMAGQATSAAYFKGNIDQDDSFLKEGRSVSLEVFGNDGKTYTIKFNITDGGDDDESTYNLAVTGITDSDNKRVATTSNVNLKLAYDKHTGRLSTIDGANAQSFNLRLEGAASVIGPITVDLSNSTNYASTMAGHNSTITVYKGDLKGLNQGYANGDMTGLSVTDNGSIYARYSNGQTVKIAQMAVAQFNNAMGLEQVGNNLYNESLNSGRAMITDITYDGGYLSAGVLEGSNVDLAKEFTDMITTQRGFQANSRVITTSDELLQTLKNLKR